MTMPIGSLVAIYFVVWWVVLFAVLPWGVRTQDDEGDVVMGTASSAPARPRLLMKAVITSIAAAAVTFLIWLAVDYYGWDVRSLGGLFVPEQ
jgi:predicted secreted protein